MVRHEIDGEADRTEAPALPVPTEAPALGRRPATSLAPWHRASGIRVGLSKAQREPCDFGME